MNEADGEGKIEMKARERGGIRGRECGRREETNGDVIGAC